MMLESVLADIVQQFLHLRNLDHTRTAKRIQRIVRKPAMPNIAAHLPGSIVSRKARKAHLLRLDQSDHGAVSILFTYGPSDDFLEVHLERTEEVLRQICAVEAHRLVRIAAIIVVPIKQR